jgi:glutamyl-Q tRNA(Asp) synthetase
MASHPIFRFAPSPNGRLHLGHAYSALFAAHWAQRLDGTFLLRIEDIDTARCKPEFDAAISDDLHWLGLSWPEPVMRQSQRFAAYAGVADTLKQMGLLYPCFCSRSQVAAAATAHDPDGAPLYPGTCRGLSEREALLRLAAGEPAQWRLRSERAIGRAGPLTIAETLPDPSAPVTHRPARPQAWGDAVLVRKDTPASYHLSVVVDDAAQGVTHVTRGMDLYHATDLHRLLQAILFLPSPHYCHHPLVTDGDQHKLAKSRGSTSIADLRSAGWTPDDIRAAVGL